MEFSKVVILQLAILAVVLEADLGRRKIGWFRIWRPIVAAVLIVPFFLSSFPTSGNNLVLQGAGALLGIGLGLVTVSPALVSVACDPDYRGHLARWRGKPGKPATVTTAGIGYASLWIVVSLARLAFAYTSQHTFPGALDHFFVVHQLDGAALTNALIFLAVGMDVFRSVRLLHRGAEAQREARLRTHTVGA